MLQSYLLPLSTHNMTSTPLIIWQYVSKLPAHTSVVRLWSDCAMVRRHNVLTVICEKELVSVTALYISIDYPFIHWWSGFLSQWLRVALSVALTVHVIECPVMAPPLEWRSTYLFGRAEARKINTDHVWEDLTGSNEFNNAIGAGYCVLSWSIVSYINFDMTVESTCSSTTSASLYQATWYQITMLKFNWNKKLLKLCCFCIEEWDGWGMWHVCETGEVHGGCW